MSETLSIRQRIIEAIITRLAQVRIANGYETDCGTHVFRAVQQPAPTDCPCFVIWPGIEEAGKKYGRQAALLPIRIEGFTAIPPPPATAVDVITLTERIIADLIEVMCGAIWTKAYTSGGGAYVPVVGDTVTGHASTATALIAGITVTTGSMGAGTAAGVLTLRRLSGTFRAENLDIGAHLDVATIAGAPAPQSHLAAATLSLAESLDYTGGGVENYPEQGHTTSGAVAVFNVGYSTIIGNPYSQ
ncbi:MAG: hypothetical protein HY770_06330 [Chitinivibrionia bacterium]|nr:hypothetical protein [Chitinivibrionia bacterium]